MTSSNTNNNINIDSLNSHSLGPLNNHLFTSQRSSSSGRLFKQLALLQTFSPPPSSSSSQQTSIQNAIQTHSVALSSLQASNALSSSSSPTANPLSPPEQSLSSPPFRSSFSMHPQRRPLSRALNFNSETSSFFSTFAPSSSSSSSIDPSTTHPFTPPSSHSFTNTTLHSSYIASTQTDSEDFLLSSRPISSSSSSTDPSKTHLIALPSMHSLPSSSFPFSSQMASSNDPEDFLLLSRSPSSSSSSSSTPTKPILLQRKSYLNSPLSFSPGLHSSSSALTPQTHSGNLFLSPCLTPSSSSFSSSSPFSPPFSLDFLSLTSPTPERSTSNTLSSPQQTGSSLTTLTQTKQKRKLLTHEEAENQATQSPSRNPSTESPSSKENIKKKFKCPNAPNARKKVIDEKAIANFVARVQKEVSVSSQTPLEQEMLLKKKNAAENSARAAQTALMANSSHQLRLPNGKTYQLSFLGKGEFKITYTFAPQQERFLEQFPNEELVIKVYDLDSPHINLQTLNTLNLNQMGQSAELQREIAQDQDISAAYILNDPEKDGFIVQRKINPFIIDLDVFFRQLRLIENQQMISALPSSSKRFLSQLRAFFTLGARLATPLDLAKEDNIFIDQTTGKATLIDFYELREEYASQNDPFAPFTHMIRGLKLWSQGNKEIIQYLLLDIQSLAQKNDLHCIQAMQSYGSLTSKKETDATTPLFTPDFDGFQ